MTISPALPVMFLCSICPSFCVQAVAARKSRSKNHPDFVFNFITGTFLLDFKQLRNKNLTKMVLKTGGFPI
jgi:hypothetical protein